MIIGLSHSSRQLAKFLRRLYTIIEHENLLNINQSGFRIYVSQLISRTHEIYRAFNYSPSLQARGISLDLSKAVDKVWHQGLLFKLESFGIRGKLLNLLKQVSKGIIEQPRIQLACCYSLNSTVVPFLDLCCC